MKHETGMAPDTFGLQEFYVTEVYTELAGSNVRVICGTKRAGVVHWLYSAVIPAEKMKVIARQCRAVAESIPTATVLMEMEGEPLH